MRRLRVSRLKANWRCGLADVARDVLEPLEARLRGALRALDHAAAARPRRPLSAARMSSPRSLNAQAQRDRSPPSRAWSRSRSRSARCARRRRAARCCSSDQRALRTVVEVQPLRVVGDAACGPRMSANRSRQNSMLTSSLSPGAKAPFAVGVQTGAAPRRLVGLDDEGAHRRVVRDSRGSGRSRTRSRRCGR